MGGERLDLVPQQLLVVAIVVGGLVVIGHRLHTRLDEQPQRTHRVAPIGAEPGQIEQRRSMAARVVDDRLEQVDGRRRLPGAIQHSGLQPRPHDRRLGRRDRGDQFRQRLDLLISPRELLPCRGGDLAIVERSHHAGQAVGVGRRRLDGGEELGQQVGLLGIEPVHDPEPVAGLPLLEGVPVDPLGGDQPIALDEAGRCVQIEQRGDRGSAERRGVDEQRLVDRAVLGREPQSLGHRHGVERARDVVVTDRTLEARPHGRDLGGGGGRRTVERRPPQRAADHLDTGPTAHQRVEPAVRTEHHVGVAAVEHPGVDLQDADLVPISIDERDLVADQPPTQW
jgi:hypothetical protein